jgi:hypothetical protein
LIVFFWRFTYVWNCKCIIFIYITWDHEYKISHIDYFNKLQMDSFQTFYKMETTKSITGLIASYIILNDNSVNTNNNNLVIYLQIHILYINLYS